jgi:hypothetical protein
MTTTTRPDLQPVRLPVVSRSPKSHTSIVMTVLGLVLLAAGLVIGRIPYTVPGGWRWSAATAYRMCRNVGTLSGTYPPSPMCSRAQLVMGGCGFLIVGGLALAVFGAAWAVRNRQNRRARRVSA